MPLSRALYGFRYIAKAYQRQRVDKWKLPRIWGEMTFCSA